jgi:hypothetical protein
MPIGQGLEAPEHNGLAFLGWGSLTVMLRKLGKVDE